MPYCPRCGTEADPDDEYCDKCGYNLSERPPVRPVRRRDEKSEKDERDEKEEKREDERSGAIMGGAIVIWLGVSFILRNSGYIGWNQFGGVFLLGIGLILIFRGLLEYTRAGSIDPAMGYLIGGGFVALMGAGITFNLDEWWPIFLVIIGIVIILRGLTERGRNPRP